ncbi:MAG TPA: hypothetical protein PKE63_05435 [Lacibacter sp.]|nr:hypothetical protein [Lacibacter sp.]HMO88202.1 hypothetical protein [Lacibacter sp.]HMP86698.1 hypothetical protein [Lacibacter sp.]
MRTSFLFLLLAVLFTAAEVMAQPVRPHRNATVPQGIRQGAITPGEARHLRQKRAHIRRDIRMARANDGRIGPLERRHIRRELREFKRHRNWAMHNRRTR